MTLIQLRDRLNEIVAENEKSGWQDRNDLEVLIEIYRGPRAADWYVPVRFASSAWLTLGSARPLNNPGAEGRRVDCVTIRADADSILVNR